MSPEYTPQFSFAHLTADTIRASMLVLDVPFWKYCSGQKTLSYLGPITCNTLPAQIKLRGSINTLNMILRNYFSTNSKRIPITCLSITSQNNLVYIYIYIYLKFRCPLFFFVVFYLFIFRITLLFSLLFASQGILRLDVLGLSHLNFGSIIYISVRLNISWVCWLRLQLSINGLLLFTIYIYILLFTICIYIMFLLVSNSSFLFIFAHTLRSFLCFLYIYLEFEDIEVICLEVNTAKRKCAIFNIYRPSCKNIDLLFNELTKLIDLAINKYEIIVVMGDFNIDISYSSSYGYQRLEQFSDIFSLQHLIKSKTCITKTSESTTDLTLTNRSQCFQFSKCVESGMSDFHRITFTAFRSQFQKPIKIQYRDFSRFDADRFLRQLITRFIG